MGRTSSDEHRYSRPAHSATVGTPAAIAAASVTPERLVGREVRRRAPRGSHRRGRCRRCPSGRPGSVSGSKVTTLAAGGAEQLLGLGVAERERPAAGHRDHGPPARRVERCRDRSRAAGSQGASCEVGRGAGDLEHRVQVDVLGDRVGQAVERVLRPRRARRPAPGRDGATGTLMPVVAAERAEHRAGRSSSATSAACRAEPAWLRITPATWTSGSKVAMPCTTAPTDREDAGDVDDEDDRGAGQRRHVGGRGEPVARRPRRRTGPSRPR